MVQSVGTNDLQLRTRRGNVDVNVGDRTWILVEQNGRCVEGELADIQANQPAAVAGMTTGNEGEVNARFVAQGRRCMRHDVGKDGPAKRAAIAKGIAQHAALGTIKSISGNSIVLTTERGGEATINTTSDTAVLNSGFVATSTLKVGDKVAVLGAPVKPADGSKPTTRTIDAWGIRVVNGTTELVGGRVESISGNTVTLTGPRKVDALTVNLDGGTAYKSASIMDKKVTLTSAVQADVKVGSILIVEGAKSSDGKTVQAKAVVIMPAKERPAKQPPANP
jgi:hypothetical protein